MSKGIMQTEIIDLRSDTVTRPTPAMLEAMFSAQVGDDVFDEDPTVKELEVKAAKMFSKEAGLFCPSGTMTNQISIRVLSEPQQEIICDKSSHIYYYEGGGIASNSGISIRLLDGDRGRINAKQVEENINPPENIHQPFTALVSIENTCNKGGGSYYTFQQMKEISEISRKHNLKTHLDGARIFNAITETDDSTVEIGKLFDTVSICLSKGLGAPVGSLILSSKENILKAKRVRKGFGGGMRQSGYLAAAGIYALDNNIKRLKDDHTRALKLAEALRALTFVENILPVETNIIVFKLRDDKPVKDFLKYLSDNNIKAVQFGIQTVRMVTHLDFNDDMLERTVRVLGRF
jgi:threonine aldolase